ncbi:MAG TPA: hypothetical protein VMU87_09935 [Stellaceae bacterium]|nr:hypothetical protein [Stellaceae bacterium]
MYTDNAEPSLDEMMSDPIIWLRMSTARQGSEGVWQSLEKARKRLREPARHEESVRRKTGSPWTS